MAAKKQQSRSRSAAANANAKSRPRRLSGRVLKKDDREETPAQILRGAIVRFFARFDLMQIIPLALLLTIGM